MNHLKLEYWPKFRRLELNEALIVKLIRLSTFQATSFRFRATRLLRTKGFSGCSKQFDYLPHRQPVINK